MTIFPPNETQPRPIVGGIVPPLVTPLTIGRKLDGDAFSGLVNRVISGGVHGLFLLGSTGEFCSLGSQTRKTVITEGCRAADNRIPVIVNVSDTSIEESLALTAHAANAGAFAVAMCPPYYFSVPQDDLFRYAQKFTEAADLPVFLYNIPQHAHSEFEVETVHRLAEIPRILGLKNSNGRLDYTAKVAQIKTQRPEFSVLTGTEELMLSAIELGADGCVCGGANLFPALYVRLFQAIEQKDHLDASNLQDLVAKIAHQIYTVGPASTSYFRGIKCALAQLGVCSEILAEPLDVFNAEEKQELRSRLNRLLPEID